MKSKEQLQNTLNEIIKNLDNYFDKMSIAMGNGNEYEESKCEEMIDYLEQRKEVLEWVLN
jgi:predicted aldo/keto reductase-like oxidoreductase